MLIRLGLIPLLISSALGSPTPPIHVRGNVFKPGKPSPTSGVYLPDTCDKVFKLAESVEDRKEAWEYTGASGYLSKLLDDGLKGWGRDFFREVKDGKIDCSVWDAETCEAAGKCPEYKPREGYYVHQSIYVLFSQFRRLFETNELSLLEGIGGDIDAVNDLFEAELPSTADAGYLFAVFIGLAVLGAGASGPHWKMGSPMTGIVGILNVASGIHQSVPEQDSLVPDPDLVEDSLVKTLRNYYDSYKTKLESTFNAIMAGDFDKLEVDDPKAFIMDTFSDGKFMSVNVANDATTILANNMKKVMVSRWPSL